jgi:hypothetical protein
MSTIKRPQLVSALLVLFITLSCATAQGLCVIPTLRVASITGQVVSKGDGLPGVTLQVCDWDDQSKVRFELSAGKDGRFDLPKVKKGKYLLVVRRDLYSTLVIPIRLEPGYKGKRKILLIHLVPAFLDPCSEGGAELKDVSILQHL